MSDKATVNKFVKFNKYDLKTIIKGLDGISVTDRRAAALYYAATEALEIKTKDDS